MTRPDEKQSIARSGRCVLMGKENERVSYWIEIAEYDLETAEAMLTTQRFLYVGFMCHQTIEKLLKGYYVSERKETPPFIHNLSRLASMSNIYHELSEDQKDLLDALEPLNIKARYPTHKEMILNSLTRTKCDLLIQKTKELSQWIMSRLLT